MLRKGQVQGMARGDIMSQIAFISSLFGMAASAEQEGDFTSITFGGTFLQHNRSKEFNDEKRRP